MPRNKQKNKAKSGSGGGGTSAPAPAKTNVVVKEDKEEKPIVAEPIKAQDSAPSVEKVETPPVAAEKPKEVKIEESSKPAEEAKHTENTKQIENGEGDTQTLKKKRNRNKKNKNQQQQGDDSAPETEKSEPSVVAAQLENQTQKKQNNKGKQQTQAANTVEKGPAAGSEESSPEKSAEPAGTGTAKRRNRNRRNKNKSNADDKDANEGEENEIEVIVEKSVEPPKDNVELKKEVSVEATVQVQEEPVKIEPVLNNKNGGKQDNKKSKQEKKQQNKNDNNKKTNITSELPKEPEAKPEEVKKIEEVKLEDNKQNKKQQGKQDKKTNLVAESPKPEVKQPDVKPDEPKTEESKPAVELKTDSKPPEPKQQQQNDNKQSPKSNKKNNAKNNNKQDSQKKQPEKAVDVIEKNIKLESKTESSSEQVAENASEIVSEPKIAMKPETDAQPAKLEVKSEVKVEVKPEAVPELKQEIPVEVKPVTKPEIIPEIKSETKPEIKVEVKPQEKQEAKSIAPVKKSEVVAEVKPEVLPQVKPEVLPDVKPEVLPDVKPEVLPDVKPEVLPDIKSEVLPEVKAEVLPEVKDDVLPEVKAVVLAEVKTEAKQEVKLEVQPELKVEASSESAKETIKPETIPETKAELIAEAAAEVKLETQPDVVSVIKPEVKVETKPDVKPEIKQEVKAKVELDVKPVTLPETKPETIVDIKKEVPQISSEAKPKAEVTTEVKAEIKPDVKLESPKPIPAAVAAVTPSQPILKSQPAAEPKPVDSKKEEFKPDHHGGKGKNKQQQKKQDKKSKTPEPKPAAKPNDVKIPPVSIEQPAAILELTTPPLELKLSEPKMQLKPEIKPKPLFNKPEEPKLNIQAIPDPIANLKKTPSPVPFISPTREFAVKLVPEIPIQEKIELKVDTSLPVSPHLSKKEAEKQLISEALSELIDAASVPEPIKIDNIKTITDKNRIESQPQPIEDTKSNASSSKNEGGSDFVLSANTATGDDTTKSLKSVSPTENKRAKDELNAKESESGDEKKLHELPEKTAQEKIEGVQFASKLLEILDAVMVASPEQKLALRTASEKLSGDGDKSINTDKQQNVDNENKTGTKPKNQPTATSPTTTSKPEIPPKPEHLTSKNKNQKQQQQQQQSGGRNNNKKKPDLLPKPGKDKIPPISQKQQQQQSSNSKNLQTVPTPPPQTSESWNDETNTIQSNSKNLISAPTPSPPKQPTTDKGWSTKQNKKQKKTSPESKNMPTTSSSATTSRIPPIQLPPELQNKKIPNIAEMLEILSKARGDLNTANSLPLSSKTLNPKELMDDGIDDDEDEEYYEYKFIPRQIFLASNCVVCQLPLQKVSPCKKCQMVTYCSDKHEKQDANNHKPLCQALYEIAEKRGGHVFHNAKVLTDDEYRSLRVHTMNQCQATLQRPLQPFEREIILFPRICAKSECRESNPDLITNCKNCQQAAYCIAHEDHLNTETHQKWCKYFDLYKKIVIQQKKHGKIEPTMPTKMAVKPYNLPKSINHVFSDLYKNFNDLKDDCGYSILTQLATAPLTALYCAQRCEQPIGDVYTIHLVGAEIQFEADTLDKWEAFFLHLVPNLVELKVVFIGPELNSENLPLDILSRIRMCRACRQSCRAVRFDFQCGKLYHSYCKTSCFTKPDLICFFNPGLHRPTGFRELDTWPETIVAATTQNCPIIVTSYTELESPKDYERLVSESKRKLNVIQMPEINPYSSFRPERNFISDEIAPMIFKNYFYFIVK